MKSNITEQQYSAGLLSEPHFDEEATLLSARPVVPLHEIKAAERSGKRLTFGLALVAALIVGALGATLIYRQRGQSPATATVETASPETNDANATPAVSTAMEAGGGLSDAPSPPSSQSASAPTSVSAKASNVSAVAKGAPRDGVAPRSQKPATPVAQNPDSGSSAETWRDDAYDPEARRAARRAERQEARRQRREAEREAEREAGGEVRGRRVQSADDLLRIREIFEGPSRPRRFPRWQ